ncbi:MAG TPA: alanine dehydrogenase [Actinomycetota bacterium]|nr:alanine dehydrogenase [Actinomycetota bacterium]
MRIGVPTEVMESEYRVALTPAGARELSGAGHEVLIQQGAGTGSVLPDSAYERAGGRIVPTAADAWSADLVLKVKEPLQSEFDHLRSGQIVFTYLHLAAHRELTQRLVDSRAIGIAYETVAVDGRLPLLAPMSEIAGRMAPHVGAHYLEKEHGAGILLGGVSGVRPARVVVLGAGTAGRNAAFLAAGMEAEVLLFDKNIDRLREVDFIHRGRIMTLYSNRESVEQALREADLVIGAVLVPGAKAPVVVPESSVKEMKPGSVLVDLSIDQGGCIETAHVTTHTDPIYELHGVVHYCVGNVPGAVPNTSTYALTNATLPFVEAIANSGLLEAIRASDPLMQGVNVYDGAITNAGVAEAHDLPYARVDEVLRG